MKQKQYCPELTVMSGIAILFVLGIHGSGSALNYGNTDSFLRIFSNFVAPAVPIFLFVSGYKYAMNDSETPYFSFLRKRLPRVLMSFALINTVFWMLDSMMYMESFDVVLLAKTYLHSWVGYSVAYQLWYIPMYCFVLILCPLVCKIIPGEVVRFCVYLVVGTLLRFLEIDYPILATYPIRFLSYPVFFEMGIVAYKKNWCDRLSSASGIAAVGAYSLVVILISWEMPEFSTNELTKYLLYYVVGTVVFYFSGILLKKSRCLQWMGTISYPLFLLHEPLIGRYISTCLGRIAGLPSVCYIAVWIGLDLFATILLIHVIRKVKLDRLLWNYKI